MCVRSPNALSFLKQEQGIYELADPDPDDKPNNWNDFISSLHEEDSRSSPIINIMKKVSIVGGHGNVSLRLAKLLSPTYSVTSIIRNPSQSDTIRSISSTPLVLSLETGTVSDFSKAFQGNDIVYFSAGGGYSEEGTKKVDYEGAVKVFDAIESVQGPKPRLILVSGVDIRDSNKIPAHYDSNDISLSNSIRQIIAPYFRWKYEADKNLVKRTAFKWTILRAGELTDAPGRGTVSIGRTHLTPTISRDDIAKVLFLLAEREDAAGLAVDVVGGDVPIAQGLNTFIEKGETDFLE